MFHVERGRDPSFRRRFTWNKARPITPSRHDSAGYGPDQAGRPRAVASSRYGPPSHYLPLPGDSAVDGAASLHRARPCPRPPGCSTWNARGAGRSATTPTPPGCRPHQPRGSDTPGRGHQGFSPTPPTPPVTCDERAPLPARGAQSGSHPERCQDIRRTGPHTRSPSTTSLQPVHDTPRMGHTLRQDDRPDRWYGAGRARGITTPCSSPHVSPSARLRPR